MIQNYIVILIGLLTAAYIIAKVVKAFSPARRRESLCPGCNGCAGSKRKERPLCG